MDRNNILVKIARVTLEGRLLRKVDIALARIAGSVLFRVMPRLDKSVAFISFQGEYTCNPKYICEEFLRRDDDVSIVWAVKDIKNISQFPKDPRVRYQQINTAGYFREFAKSKVIITNSLSGTRNCLLPIQKDQVLVETWHGSLGLKKFDPSQYPPSDNWPKRMKSTAKKTSFCISNSKFENEVYRTSYWPKTKIKKYGHARNDIFFEQFKEKREELRKTLFSEWRIDEDTKLVLYGPTFRGDHQFAEYGLDIEKILQALSVRFGGEKWLLMLRYHPTVRVQSSRSNRLFSNKIIDVTYYPDMQELMAIADVGITDYSSWMFDYMLARKPIFLYTPDLNEYQEGDRGFFYSIHDTPFPLGYTNEEVVNNILAFDEKEYLNGVNSFLKDKGCIDDGNASKRIVDYIMKLF